MECCHIKRNKCSAIIWQDLKNEVRGVDRVDRVVDGADDGEWWRVQHETCCKIFQNVFPASGQLHFDGVINLKGAGTRSVKEIKMYEQQ